jgi:hypothetical protein
VFSVRKLNFLIQFFEGGGGEEFHCGIIEESWPVLARLLEHTDGLNSCII